MESVFAQTATTAANVIAMYRLAYARKLAAKSKNLGKLYFHYNMRCKHLLNRDLKP